MTTGKALNGKPYEGNPHVRFDEGKVASTMPRRGSLLCRCLIMAVVSVFVLWTGAGETFSWRHAETYSEDKLTKPNWKSFKDYENWAVGTDKTSENPDSRIPGSEDDIFYGRETENLQCFDLGGEDHTVRRLYSDANYWQPHYFLVRNGGLVFSESFTNIGARVCVFNGGRFVLGVESSTRGGIGGTPNVYEVHDGGELQINGAFYIHKLQMTVEQGGSATLQPSVFDVDSTANKNNGITFIRNRGTLNLPSGVQIGGYGGVRPNVILFEQLEGVMNVGGNFNMKQYGDRAEFVLSGGTVNVTADSKFVNFGSVVMTNDAVATVNVAEGKTLDLTKMDFRSGTILTKIGDGVVKFGASVPETLNVAEGSMALAAGAEFGNLDVNVAAGEELYLSATTFRPGAVLVKRGDGVLKLGSEVPSRVEIVCGTVVATKGARFGTVSFSAGGKLHLAATGISVKNVEGAEDAAVTIEEALGVPNAPIFRVDDAEAMRIIAQKLTAPDGYENVVNGGTLSFEKPHSGSVFYWKKEGNAGYWNFYNPSLWGVGKTIDSGNDGGWLPGENDEIYYGNAYQRYMYFDMGGGTRWIKGLSDGTNPTQEKYGYCHIKVKNGTLAFVSCFTNSRAYVTAEAGGRFVLGENCGTKMGHGSMQNKYTVNDAGECIIGGMVDMHIMQSTVNPGGRFVFDPVRFTFAADVTADNFKSYIRNNGTLELPDGMTLGGASKGGCTFTVEQLGGEMLLGGGIVMADKVDHLDFRLSNGTVRVVDDAAFVGCRTVVMLGGGSATIDVADGKTADFSAMAFDDGTALTKTGTGSLKLGGSVPGTLSVPEGRLVVGGAASFGAGLSFGAGAGLHFAAGGMSAESIAGLEDVAVTVDRAAVRCGTTLFASPDEDLANAMAEKLTPVVKAVTDSCRTLAVIPSETGAGFQLKVVSDCGLRIILR